MTPETQPRSSRISLRWKVAGILIGIGLLLAAIVVRLVISRAQPILRARVIETLSNRFKSKVELETLNVSVFRGLEVSGGGLKIYGATDPNPYAPGVQPLISLQRFHFHTGIRNLFRPSMHIDTVYITGMELNIPPKEDRAELGHMNSQTRKISVYVDNFICQNAVLLINTSKPDKPPLEFAIGDLKMKDIGKGLPMRFDATLVNPKPVGNIHSTGLFGPFHETDPRDTPVQGEYSFRDADLGTIKGIGGILSSTGKYEGTLSSIQVDGSTDTPDFRIARSGHPMPLHTDFHAIVDGTNGDTRLEPVKAKLQDSSFTAQGSIERLPGKRGRDVRLDVVLDGARIQDLLKLGVKTNPPIMTGQVEMKAKFDLPPGTEDVADRLRLAGSFHVLRAHFTKEKIQEKLDALSLRTQGKLKEARDDEAAGKKEEDVPVDLQGTFDLKDGTLAFSVLHFQIPGTHVDMAGVYSLDGGVFDFHGKVMMDAKLSQMTTGWKSLLLKPADRFFSKDGAGTELPVKISGTESEPRFGLDFGHKETQTPQKNLESSAHR